MGATRRGRPVTRDDFDRFCLAQRQRLARTLDTHVARIENLRSTGTDRPERSPRVDTYRLLLQPIARRLDQLDGEPED